MNWPRLHHRLNRYLHTARSAITPVAPLSPPSVDGLSCSGPGLEACFGSLGFLFFTCIFLSIPAEASIDAASTFIYFNCCLAQTSSGNATRRITTIVGQAQFWTASESQAGGFPYFTARCKSWSCIVECCLCGVTSAGYPLFTAPNSPRDETREQQFVAPAARGLLSSSRHSG